MKRRTLVAALGAVLAAPAVAQSRRPVIGYLSARSLETDGHLLAAFRIGLKEAGFVDGQNVTMEFRWAEGDFGRVDALAAELVKRKPDLLVATGGTSSPLAFKALTTTMPIVFTFGTDPVALGLVKSYSRPGGNLTGATMVASSLEGKRLDLLHEMVPGARSVALLTNPSSLFATSLVRDARSTASARGLSLNVLNASNLAEIDRAFEAMAADKVEALLISTDGFLIGERERILARTAALRLPAMYPAREFADAGGLASYAAPLTDMYRWAGVYAGRILKGAKPADLPVQQPTTYELVVNLKAARTLGLALPPAFVARADDTIE
jgi:putative tryptophan/tyrosine transport system substrate-binding protein